MRVERALARLQTLLSKRGITSTAAALGLALTQNAVSAAPSSTASTIAATSLSSATAAGSSVVAYFLMTKLQLTLAGAAVIALAIGLSLQTAKNHRLQDQLTELQTQLGTSRAATTKIHAQVAQCEATVKHLDEAIAAQTPPLTPEQQERLRLDTIVRKGELDSEYAPLFRRLKLAPEPLDKLKALIVERNQVLFDANKLAKSEGLEFATPTESRPLAECVTSDVDSKIAALLGHEGYAQFREYLERQPYHLWAISLLSLEPNLGASAQEILSNPTFDKRSEELARIILAKAPRYLDQQSQANGWPVAPPAEFRAAVAQVLSPEAMQRFDENTLQNAQRRRMYEIARDAALQGKLKLSKNSARDYPTAAQNQPSSAK